MRRLTVRREALAELSAADLVVVAGGEQITRLPCKIPTVWDSCLCPTYVPPPTGMC